MREIKKAVKENKFDCLVKLVKAKCHARQNDGEGAVVSPSVACWTWKIGKEEEKQ